MINMVGFTGWCTHESLNPFCACLLTPLDTEELPWGYCKSPRRQYPWLIWKRWPRVARWRRGNYQRLQHCQIPSVWGRHGQVNISTYMTKSMPPSSLTQRSTAFCKFSNLRTSTEPIPITLAPGRAVAMSLATRSVFSTLRPMMQALAPRCTKARTWALQIVPAPPVQKTTLFAG